MEEFEVPEIVEEEKERTKDDFDGELYKKWYKAGEHQGFVSIRPWLKAGKLVIDIGKRAPEGGLASNTECFVPATAFAAYLRAVVEGRAQSLYPVPRSNDPPTPEGIVFYGGSPAKRIARVFKAHHYPRGRDAGHDPSAFIWKCGHFEGNTTSTGAITPDKTKPLSIDTIKMTRQEIAVISYTVDVAINAYAAQNVKWYNV